MMIHDSMLFRWIGYDVEKPNLSAEPAPRREKLTVKPNLTENQLEAYLNRLRDALNPKIGVKVSAYSCADVVGKQPCVTKPKPCLFFTEQAAGDPEEHWRLYGRLGFGFSKRFVFSCGGRPVIYAGGRNDPVLAAINILRKVLSKSKNQRAQQELETVARFVKCTTLPREQTGEPEETAAELAARAKAGSEESKPKRVINKKANINEYPNTQPIRFLREREWRMLHQENDTQRWRIDADGSTWFTPEAGKELQIVVVPCNLILHQAYEDKNIRQNLRGRSGVAAQLISAQALRKL